MKKRFLAAAVAVCMLFLVYVPTMAVVSVVPESEFAEEERDTPSGRFVNTSSVTFSIKYASNVATCSSKITGKSGTKSISAVYTLQRKNGLLTSCSAGIMGRQSRKNKRLHTRTLKKRSIDRKIKGRFNIMKISLKRKISVICATMVLASLLAVPASAANTSDSVYSFSVGQYDKGGIAGKTEKRQKTNTSSMYLKDESGVALQMQGRGSTTSGGTYVNKTIGGVGAMSPSAQVRVRTTIYESGMTWAQFHIWTWYAGNRTLKGKWSPDCAGTYPYAN
ncbi:MAG: hypothetical protein FWH04_09855 [Oscillospiraceae bacterium]|nr:hypothetical protein [Oscillospiraceae bacterium]